MLKALIVMFVFLFFAIAFEFVGQTPVTGMATAANASSQVVVQGWFAIAFGSNFSASGIDFGTIQTLPSNFTNASLNYAPGKDGDPAANYTLYNISVSTDSNVAVDFCLKANESLRTSGAIIDLGNYSWSNGTTNSLAVPSIATTVNMSTNYLNATKNVAAGNEAFFRFWLTVPVATTVGTYTNTIEFVGKQAGTTCP